jgi:hypothetical protein
MMGILKSLLAGTATQPIEAIGNVVDQLFTSDEEKAQAEIVLAKMRQHPQILQAEINKIEAQHRSIFVAGWRPFIGWICGIGLFFTFIINPLLQWWSGQEGPALPLDAMTMLVTALLGLGGLRTFEKLSGRAK